MKSLDQFKIAYVHKSGCGWGGAQQNIFDLVNNFKNEFGELIFVCNRSMLLEKVKSLQIKTYSIPISSVKMLPITLVRLGIILFKEKPDLIHSNHRYVTFLLELLRCFFSRRYKILHTARSVFRTKTIFRFFGDKIIANSHAVKKNLIKKFHVTSEKIEIIYDGVNLTDQSSILLSQQNDPVFQLLDLSHKTVIGCIGSLVKVKGHSFLFQALAQLPYSIQNQILVLIIGEGPLQKKSETAVKNLNLSAVVKFLGYRANVQQLLSYCNFIVIPSIQEGLPNVLIEAYLSGKPAIVSKLDYVDEIILPYNIGLVFPVMETKKLAEAIQIYVEQSELAEKHGASGKKIFTDRFSLEQNLAKYRFAYQSLMELV